ncbi:precorrin-6A synthase (deacetylating) [Rhodobacter aestuarii]|uniref:Precorrin-6A synthase [deacetylating] n=1 Tax=Rhodobacter aestuarii TaxID=453582 RepID=A0A1N7J3X4_9RHOB|nr:precorrin-6A synthase (deacetylating) [Rhodobacter aestuarii]PTV97213.1 precorrin-6A synthase (deacetylating) [Rhodobacter aestuarii]SIS44065.1 precorrin-6A synthase (deacetylating) [Rhodobacter aestuarii]
MIELTLIGIGTGNPAHVTLQAIGAMNAADLILIPLKGADKSDLAGLRRAICATHITNPATKVVEFDLPVRDAANPSYRKGVDDWHDAIAEAWLAQITAQCPDLNGKVALLVWGDPALYDSTLRIAARLEKRIALTTKVIPGITAIQALCAAHAIPLNDIGAPFVITTGRQIRDHGWPAAANTVVVMLDGECSFQSLDPQGISIWWGGCVAMPEEVLVAGPLAEVTEQILATRAALRATHGWVMDIYLMRRSL